MDAFQGIFIRRCHRYQSWECCRRFDPQCRCFWGWWPCSSCVWQRSPSGSHSQTSVSHSAAAPCSSRTVPCSWRCTCAPSNGWCSTAMLCMTSSGLCRSAWSSSSRPWADQIWRESSSPQSTRFAFLQRQPSSTSPYQQIKQSLNVAIQTSK